MELNDKIYVAGDKGLVGSAIIRRLELIGYKNIITVPRMSVDLSRQEEVENWFESESPQYVFLAAALVGGINYNKTHPANFMYENLAIQNNIIESCRLFGVEKLMFLGSSCIYPKKTKQPIKESYLMSGPLEPTNEGYALAKISGLKMCKAYYDQYGMNSVSAMPANIYGINDNFDEEQSHVVPAMIMKFIEAQREGDDSVIFFGDGSPVRDFMYVDDLADALVFLMNNYDDPYHINVGSGTGVSIKDLSKKIAKIIGYHGDIFWDRSKPNGSPERTLDKTRMTNLGWKPSMTLEEGLEKTINWYSKDKWWYK